jgi:hypothetical protein
MALDPFEPFITILSRDLRTLEVDGEIGGSDTPWRSMRWHRRDVEAGEFTLVVPRIAAIRPLVKIGQVIEVRRGGQFEFAGVITSREIRGKDNEIVVSGPDLKGYFLERRMVGRTAEVSVAAVAGETAMKTYVSGNGGTSGDLFSAELSVDWNVEADVARGATVDFTALRRNLLSEVLAPIARRADLWHDVVILDGPARYEYRVYGVTDATEASGALPFSLGWDNVGDLTYRESIRGVANDVTVLGDGTGDTRTVRSVEDSDHITTYGRTHGAIDARDATSNDELDEAGETAIADAIRESVNVTAVPLLGDEPGARYGTDWDIGRVVTVAITEEGISVDRLVVGVDFAAERRGGDTDEQITMLLGDVPRTLGELLVRERRQRNRASFE